jgi:hypothetical protein
MARKPMHFDIKFGFLSPLTYVVTCDDGAMFWCQPKNGVELQWMRVKDVPQDAPLPSDNETFQEK